MNPLNTEIEYLIADLTANKKYSVLCPETIKNIVISESPKHKSLKTTTKAARKKLHLVLADYLVDLKFPSAEKDLTTAFSPGNENKIRDACLDIMSKHASTRERIPILPDFYHRIFQITGSPKKLADLACALNPLSFRWMNLPYDTDYYAFDNNAKIVDLLKLYFSLEGLKPLVEWRDILCNPPELHFDVALLFKMYHCLEIRQKGAGWKVIRDTPSQWIAVSFPTRNLANRKVDIFSNYKNDLLHNTRKNNWEHHLLEFDSEMVLLINKLNAFGDQGAFLKKPMAWAAY